MSVDNLCSCSSSNQDVAAHLAADRLRLLEGIGSFGVSLTFYVLRKSRDLPCFVGSAIGAVEDFVSPCIEPLATKVGTEGMYLLSIADDKLYALGEIAMDKVPLVSGFVSNAKAVNNIFEQVTTVASSTYDQVCDRGIIGAAADTWVKYEVTVKSKSEDYLQFMKRIPLMRVFVPIIYTVGTPIVSTIFGWLTKRSELQGQHLILHEVRLLDHEMDLEDVSKEKHLFVVDNGTVDSSSMDSRQSCPETDFGDRSSIPESPECSTPRIETVKKEVVFQEVGEVEPVQGETSGNAKSDPTVVRPVTFADDDSSDDELTVLFNSGWHVGKVSPLKGILVEPKASKRGWW
ncbi:hypothetical protein M758_2G185600 [Ceratodon purpureus]|nr:hypothetical protein M758_2G185600 [Ceratodon purpureus]